MESLVSGDSGVSAITDGPRNTGEKPHNDEPRNDKIIEKEKSQKDTKTKRSKKSSESKESKTFEDSIDEISGYSSASGSPDKTAYPGLSGSPDGYPAIKQDLNKNDDLSYKPTENNANKNSEKRVFINQKAKPNLSLILSQKNSEINLENNPENNSDQNGTESRKNAYLRSLYDRERFVKELVQSSSKPSIQSSSQPSMEPSQPTKQQFTSVERSSSSSINNTDIDFGSKESKTNSKGSTSLLKEPGTSFKDTITNLKVSYTNLKDSKEFSTNINDIDTTPYLNINKSGKDKNSTHKEGGNALQPSPHASTSSTNIQKKADRNKELMNNKHSKQEGSSKPEYQNKFGYTDKHEYSDKPENLDKFGHFDKTGHSGQNLSPKISPKMKPIEHVCIKHGLKQCLLCSNKDNGHKGISKDIHINKTIRPPISIDTTNHEITDASEYPSVSGNPAEHTTVDMAALSERYNHMDSNTNLQYSITTFKDSNTNFKDSSTHYSPKSSLHISSSHTTSVLSHSSYAAAVISPNKGKLSSILYYYLYLYSLTVFTYGE